LSSLLPEAGMRLDLIGRFVARHRPTILPGPPVVRCHVPRATAGVPLRQQLTATGG
jgi:hypothetical protein